ncbi:TetR/AcrR family transcriptional regulator [Nocardia asteroides]|uniref:TetR/AcrR family transcriptional regulator n=1 Tax=Nocardia asteroides TaxID=1824 RepID=UPI0037CC7833
MSELEGVVTQRRPGGRATKVKEAVRGAVLEAMAEHGADQVRIPDIARRAGVCASSIYRRWGTRENLILDVMLNASEAVFPLPDTGTLRGDLTTVGIALTDYLDTPRGKGLVRALTFMTDSAQAAAARRAFWDKRYSESKAIFTRAMVRGELPSSTDIRFAIELFVTPIHLRQFFLCQPTSEAYIGELTSWVIRALQLDANDEERDRRSRRVAASS